MKDGIIQQVDTPQNLYDMPCNMFVAGFIGSPQMNFLDGTVTKNGDQYAIDPVSYTHLDVYKRQLKALPYSVQSMKYSKRSVKAGSSGLRLASGLISTG